VSECTSCWGEDVVVIDADLRMCDLCKAWHLLRVAWGKKFPDLPMPREARLEDVLDVVTGKLPREAIVDG
jgi:hypothetical protein